VKPIVYQIVRTERFVQAQTDQAVLRIKDLTSRLDMLKIR